MSRIAVLSLAAIIVASIGVGRVHATEPQSTFEEFKQFGDKLVGRWVVDVTLIADWPGEKAKQGDKITGYTTFKWIADGKGLEWDSVGGMTTSKTLVTFDATTNRIKTFNVGSAGGNWQTIIWKKSDDEWGWKFTGGGLVDGRKFGGQGSWVFKSDKKHAIQGTITLDGNELPKLNDIYTQVSE